MAGPERAHASGEDTGGAASAAPEIVAPAAHEPFDAAAPHHLAQDADDALMAAALQLAARPDKRPAPPPAAPPAEVAPGVPDQTPGAGQDRVGPQPEVPVATVPADDAQLDRMPAAPEPTVQPEGPPSVLTEPAAAPSEMATAAAPRRRHRLGLRTVLGLGLFLPLIFAAIAAIGMIGQEITAPSWIRARVEARAAEVLSGGSLTFGAITVTVGRDLHPVVRMTGTVLRDAGGAVLARVPGIAITLSPRGLILRREVMPQEITLTGADIALNRARDGTVALAFGGGSGQAEQAESLAAIFDTFDRLFEGPGLEALNQVSAEGLIVSFRDARAQQSWTVDGGSLALDLRGDVTRLTGDLALLSGRSYVTTLRLAYESPRGSPAADVTLTVIDAAAADIATQSASLSWLSVLDARLSASLRLRLDAQGDLSTFRASLKLGAGALAPVAGVAPVGFDYARADLDYDPATQAIRFSRVAVLSDWGGVRSEGQAWLSGMQDGLPQAITGQFALSDITLNPPGLYPAPLAFPAASVDLRLQLAPFRVTVGQFTVTDAGGPDTPPLTGRAEIGASPEGWEVAVDAVLPETTRARVMELWPPEVKAPTRMWFVDNLPDATLLNTVAGLRIAPGAAPRFAMTQEFAGATIRALRQLPPITAATGHVGFADGALSVTLDAGVIAAPQGGAVDVAGTMLVIPDTNRPDPPATVFLASDSTVTAALSLLDLPPFQFLTKADLPVTLADGRARVTGQFDLPLKDNVPAEQIAFAVTAALSDVQSAVLVPGRTLTATALTARVTPDLLTIGGPLRLGRVPADLTFRQAIGPGAGAPATVEGTVQLSERFLEEFAIGLPPGSLRGEGQARVTVELARAAPPRFTLESDLSGLALALPAVGWSKSPSARGSLQVAGTLGPVPQITRLALDAGGLAATGRIDLTAGGGLDRARFDRVRIGGWLDGPLDLVGRGAGAAPGVVIQGGTLDLRQAAFGDSGGQGGPMTLALDRLQVTEGIALTGFRGEFDADGGFEGTFTAGVNGQAAVRGSVVPHEGRSAVRIVSDDAGDVLRAAGFLENAQQGALDLTWLPAGGEGTYDGHLTIGNLRVRNAPALASLLNAISVVGLLQQLGGQGLYFDEVEADFRIDPDRITVLRSSAIGAGLGISLDGIYTLASGTMDFQGVISPFYLLNGIGAILTRRGEGLIGFNFTLRGPMGDPRVGVNPLSVLTPGMFREIFRRPPPEVAE